MINKKLGIGANLNIKTLRSEDVVYVVRHLFQVKLGSKPTDDIDHLGNRRVRSVGELLENQFRVGLPGWSARSRSGCRSRTSPT